MLGFVKLSFEHYKVNIKKFKSLLLYNSSFSINLILYNFYCVAVILDQMVFVDEVWTVSTWTQDAWWKEILCDKGIWMYSIIWYSCNEAVTLPFNDIDVHYLHGNVIEWSHSCMFSSFACQTLYHTSFFLERREGQEGLAHETTCFHGDLVKDSLS